jgi:hypothetical protein
MEGGEPQAVNRAARRGRNATAGSRHRSCGGAVVRRQRAGHGQPGGDGPRLTGRRGREVLTVSGIFIAKFTKTQRSQRSVYRRPDLGAV